MSNTPSLLPCPFCGGINIIHCSHHMYCHACGADGPDADSQHESEAIAAWNRRPQQSATASLSEMPYEKRKAIQEGEQIGASDAWFKARHEMLDTIDRRNVFRAGFVRGWDAALAAQERQP